MDVLFFKVIQRNIECICNDTIKVIGDNADYEAVFQFDAEWNGKIKTARFVNPKTNRYKDAVIANDRCVIPVEMLKKGFLSVGVFSDVMTTTPCQVLVKESIREKCGAIQPPKPDVYEQLLALIESGMLKGDPGEDGIGINKIEKTSTEGLVDTYTIYFTDGSTKTYEVINGQDGNGILAATLNQDYTLTLEFTNGTSYTTPSIRGEQGEDGATGNGITSAVLNADYTMTLTFTDGSSYTTPVIRGAQGAPGQNGSDGADGQDGADGFSPVVETSEITGGHSVSVTDKTHTETFDVLDGVDGQDGRDGINDIDDEDTTSTDKLWSAKQIHGTITDHTSDTDIHTTAAEKQALQSLYPSTPPSAVGKILKVLSVNQDGTFICEWADEQSLADYVKNTDYASSAVGGVVKTSITNMATDITKNGVICASNRTLGQYYNLSNNAVIGKGTLENIKSDLTKRALTDSTQTAWTSAEQLAACARIGAASGATAYQKPQSGIPSTDMSTAVQESLEKADTALQEHQDISGLATKEEVTTGLAGKQEVISDLQTIRTGASAGATAYQKPSAGIPKTDFNESVQKSIDNADFASSRKTRAAEEHICYGYLTTGSTELNLCIPLRYGAYYRSGTDAPSLTTIVGSVRLPSGGYVGGSGYNFLTSGATISCAYSPNGLKIVATMPGGWKTGGATGTTLTNNITVCGNITIAGTY